MKDELETCKSTFIKEVIDEDALYNTGSVSHEFRFDTANLAFSLRANL
jgi:hypothetical protein